VCGDFDSAARRWCSLLAVSALLDQLVGADKEGRLASIPAALRCPKTSSDRSNASIDVPPEGSRV
jgi:hypothetical protein